MELSSSNDEEEESENDSVLEYWNNWMPLSEPVSNKPYSVTPKFENHSVSVYSENANGLEVSWCVTEPKSLRNWIPPLNFFNIHKLPIRKNIKLDFAIKVKKEKICETPKTSEKKTNSNSCEKEINVDWGQRVEISDVSDYNDGDCFWGIVHLGMFANIKLWVNEYNNICGSADGEISNPNSSEITCISITNKELLRKMLNLSKAQWLSLCETVQKNKANLKFDAVKSYEEKKLTPLEKLWFFVCKARHYQPSQSMLVRLSGAVKNLKKLEIIPKVEVLDIRSLTGDLID